MKRTIIVLCGLACCVMAVSGPVSAQEKFEKNGVLAAAGLVPAAAAQLPPAYRPVEPGQDLIGNVSGTNITMKAYDHAVAGAVNGGLVWGFFDEAAGVSRLTMRKYSQTISAEFKRQEDKSLGGVITSTDGSTQRVTSVFLAGADAVKRTFNLRINEEVVTVTVTPESMAGGHFVNPTYSAVIGGKPVSYRIEVEGCLGYSIQMGMIILGSYTH